MRHVRIIAGLWLGALVSCVARQHPTTANGPVQSRMRADLAYLASPELEGRLTGTPGNDSAAVFIGRRYSDLGLAGAFDSAECDKCLRSFYQEFQLSPYTLRRLLDVPHGHRTQNVGAIVNGTDSLLRHEYVIVGAHYDHIGRSGRYSLDGWVPGAIRPGADDNASGTTAVLELARRFAGRPARRPILFANFTAEELGMVGSQVFVANSPVPNNAVVAMVNLDMVGRLRGDKLIVLSGEDSGRLHAIVDSVDAISPPIQFKLQWQPASRALSDYASFASVHIPVIGFFTDTHLDYHRTTDVVDRINFDGLEKIVDLTERVVRAIANGNGMPPRQPDKPTH